MHKISVYLFRQDLRLEDNPAFSKACAESQFLIPIYCKSPENQKITKWGFPRVGTHRSHFLRDSLNDLSQQLRAKGSELCLFEGEPIHVLQDLIKQLQVDAIYCEEIAAPEEQNELGLIKNLAKDSEIPVHTTWQSCMIDSDELPFSVDAMPEQFTQFRIQIEKRKHLFTQPKSAPKAIPQLPEEFKHQKNIKVSPSNCALSTQSSFPYWKETFRGGELHAKQHLQQYLQRRLPHSYKKTRNGLFGEDYSSKFSPWLANGSLSPKVIMVQLKKFEAEFGANEGSYWLWFELLWRDYFRVLHLKWGNALYHARGLSDAPPPQHNPKWFEKWCAGNTGESIVDAGMRELHATGYLSNRLRQVVASYLIYDLNGDWRAGAAWFESQLIDYDVYSNQGNWLYIAGRGTDPRGGRRFNPKKQADDHDLDSSYRSIWL
jgi:deoxyribodipyrimidine photo-lyase